MAHEKQLKAMMYACNANNWDSWENLEDQCHSEPAMVDARYIVTLDKVLSKGKHNHYGAYERFMSRKVLTH